ncbi:laccase [Suillus discolor]|uniref:Laccase n=1 Tax=Suillus discolor TaxID=1912936 RepID=A0A9P7JXP0_9AGAM|nr:laccase [Suillus discolor]KAG2114628.1 laccase [Suillus discolor]
MFIPFLLVSLISSIDVTAIAVSRSEYPLSQGVAHGPSTRLTIGNTVLAPDGFVRPATVVNGMFPGPMIAAQKGDLFNIEVVNQLSDESMFTLTSVCDGLRGALIIYDPDDPLASMYDVDDATTVISLSDWYHVVSPKLLGVPSIADSMLINGLGRFVGGPPSDLAVINVTPGKRYRLRLIQMSCQSDVKFSIDGHSLTVIEADGQLTEPLVVDQLQILAGQRYSVVLQANQPVKNYWVRGLPNTPGANYIGGVNSAILRYQGAPAVNPITIALPPKNQLQETNLHALPVDGSGVPGIPGYGNADINLDLEVSVKAPDFQFYINGITFGNTTLGNHTVPVLLQILSGARQATELLPAGSVYVLEANKVVEVTVGMQSAIGGPHPIHLHGHAFDVVQSAGSSTFNYVNPVRRDVVSAGHPGQRTVIRFVTDNSGPWFLHCHIDWHLAAGFGVVFAESPADTPAYVDPVPAEWDRLCPIYDNQPNFTLPHIPNIQI